MIAKSRTYNSVRNIIFGLVTQVLLTVLNFISRTIFIEILGVEFLGISGLFYNILTILSLAELGIGTAMNYSLYKPLVENDTKQLSALMNYYKTLYKIIALIVIGVGCTLIPFLGFIVKTDKFIPFLRVYYILFLINSATSYLLAYKTAIINADQKMYIIKSYSFVFATLQFVMQTFFLYTTRSYSIYLIVQVICTLLQNVFISNRANKMYPWLEQRHSLTKLDKSEIYKNVKSMLLYRIGGVLFGGTDNILISTIVGTVWVGYYFNYNMIVNAIMTFTTIFFNSLYGSIGNLNATKDNDKKFKIFNALLLIAFWISGFGTITLFVLLNDFITIWIGEQYILDRLTVLAIVINFYLSIILNPLWSFRETTGLFRKTKYVMLFTTIVNLVLSILLGQLWGIFGILIATVIARLTTYFWYEPIILYRDYFKKSVTSYFKKHAIFMIVLIVASSITFYMSSFVQHINILSLIIKLIICIIIPNLIFTFSFFKTEEFNYIRMIITNKIINKE